MIEFVTVHHHLVNVSLKLWHMMILVSSNLLFDHFQINRLQDHIEIVWNLKSLWVHRCSEWGWGLVSTELHDKPEKIDLEGWEGFFENGRNLTFLAKGFLTWLEWVKHEAFLFTENDGIGFFVLFVEFLVRIVVEIISDFVRLERVAFGE